MSPFERQLNGMIWFVDCGFSGDAKIIYAIPANFKLSNQLHQRERKIDKTLFISSNGVAFQLQFLLESLQPAYFVQQIALLYTIAYHD